MDQLTAEEETVQPHELTVMVRGCSFRNARSALTIMQVDQLIHDLQYSISRVSTDLTTKMDDMSTRLDALDQMLRQSLEGVPQATTKKKEGSA
ncbi:hypothetical protein YB2330_000490 [Saitoella coloradoensis]